MFLGSTYVLYRLPYADEVRIVVQLSGSVQQFLSCAELDNHRGFVLIPFSVTAEHPILLVRTDRCFTVSMPELKADVTDGTSFRSETGTGDRTAYHDCFTAFHDAVQRGKFGKLVLSRKVEGTYSGNPILAFIKACEMYPRAMVYMACVPDEGIWLGATPEILLSGSHSHYRTVALAGTMPYAEGAVWSEKNRQEQAIVARYIRNVLTPMSSVVEEEGPYTSRAGHLIHLKSEFHFSPLAGQSISSFVQRLHPTPAVCGMPKDEAHTFISEHEAYNRTYYSGVVGMLDAQDETDLYVNLRCAHFLNDRIELFAGGGIMPDSDEESEWRETESKLQTICSVLKTIYFN